MKKLIFILLTYFCIQQIQGQQIFSSSQYMLNHYSVNPAAAGSFPFQFISVSYRQLWSGIDEAPNTQSVNTHLPVTGRVGVGGKLYNINTGSITRTGFEATYAYHLPVKFDKSRISFGLSSFLYQYSLKTNDLTLEDPDDELISSASNRMIVPDFSLGVYFYTADFYAGLSVPNLVQRNIGLFSDGQLQQKQIRHYFLLTGYNYIVNRFISIEPSSLVKFVETGLVQADFNARLIYKQKAWAGFSYRTSDAVVGILGITTEFLEIGYSYDLVLSDINKHSSGSHEIMVVYKFFHKEPKRLDLRNRQFRAR